MCFCIACNVPVSLQSTTVAGFQMTTELAPATALGDDDLPLLTLAEAVVPQTPAVPASEQPPAGALVAPFPSTPLQIPAWRPERKAKFLSVGPARGRTTGGKFVLALFVCSTYTDCLPASVYIHS